MIEFFIGVICGMITMIGLTVVLIYFHKPADIIMQRAEKIVENIKYQNKGFIYFPPDDNEAESEAVREKIIKKNNEMGVDTPVDELR